MPLCEGRPLMDLHVAFRTDPRCRSMLRQLLVKSPAARAELVSRSANEPSATLIAVLFIQSLLASVSGHAITDRTPHRRCGSQRHVPPLRGGMVSGEHRRKRRWTAGTQGPVLVEEIAKSQDLSAKSRAGDRRARLVEVVALLLCPQ